MGCWKNPFNNGLSKRYRRMTSNLNGKLVYKGQEVFSTKDKNDSNVIFWDHIFCCWNAIYYIMGHYSHYTRPLYRDLSLFMLFRANVFIIKIFIWYTRNNISIMWFYIAIWLIDVSKICFLFDFKSRST